MIEKKMILQELSDTYNMHPFIIVLNFHSIPVKKWKLVKNAIYKLHQSVKLRVVQNQLLKKVENDSNLHQIISLCKGPTCFLLCYSLQEFKDIATKVFRQSQESSSGKDVPEFSLVGAKYDGTFIQEVHLKRLLSLQPTFDHVSSLKSPSQKLCMHLKHPMHKLLQIFMANNGN